jgi:SAM-dependent methyltransferase
MTFDPSNSDYQNALAEEAAKWGDHLNVEASGGWLAWLDHPLIAAHYFERSLINGLRWEHWIRAQFGEPAERSLDLGCGSASRSLLAYENGATRFVEGFDASPERISQGEADRQARGIPGRFQVVDVNHTPLSPASFDLVFSCHSFHHFYELEYIMAEVHEALTPRGFFVLEEFVGPTQFQWTDQQMDIVRVLTSSLPERLRIQPWGALKILEGRPTPEEVVASSPFESIRSAEIGPLFERYFDVVATRSLGGTIQHLLYNGIMHNFSTSDPEAVKLVETIYAVEDRFIDSGLLPSDFKLLIGQRRDAPLPHSVISAERQPSGK